MKIYFRMSKTSDGTMFGKEKNQTYTQYLDSKTHAKKFFFRYYEEEKSFKKSEPNYSRVSKLIKRLILKNRINKSEI